MVSLRNLPSFNCVSESNADTLLESTAALGP